jgi:hypothetical protein
MVDGRYRNLSIEYMHNGTMFTTFVTVTHVVIQMSK